MHDIVTVLSLGLTLVYLQYVWRILSEWWPSTRDIIKNPGEITGSQWLIIGVFTGFIAGFGDNIVWGILWLIHYLGFGLDQYGVGAYFNVVLRQSLGIISAYAHIRSILLYFETSPEVNHLRIWGIGAVGAFALLMYRYCGALL